MNLFERSMRRAEAVAEARAAQKADSLADRMRDQLPPGISAERIEGGVRLEGRGLGRRLALEPALRWLVERLR